MAKTANIIEEFLPLKIEDPYVCKHRTVPLWLTSNDGGCSVDDSNSRV